MKRLLIGIVFALVISGCSGQTDKGKLPLSSEEMQGKSCEEIVYLLEEAGFTNIETIPMLDLESEKEEGLDNTIQKIEIGGQADFKKGKRFDFATPILISYHSYAERSMIITSEEAKGESYNEIVERISKAGFFNVKEEVIRDADNDNTYDNEVEGIQVEASDRYSLKDSYPLNTEIIVYHSFIERKMPITSEEAKGKELEEVKALFSGTKFEVEYKLIEDGDDDNVHEDEVEYIEIDSSSNYTLEESYPINAEVTVYHSYLEDKMPISSADAKGKTYGEVLELFKNTKFQNVTIESATAPDNIEVAETIVDKIVINGESDYTTKETYPFNSEIVIHYSIRHYNVSIELKCKKSGLFSPEYDILVYLDGEEMGSLPYAEGKSFDVELKKGTYTLTLESEDDSETIGTGTFDVNADRSVRYDIKCRSSKVEMTYYEPLSIPYTSNDAVGKNIDTVVKAYEDAGYRKVKTKEINDLEVSDLSQSNAVSKILINNSQNFSQKSTFYSDSEVVIHYHAGKLIDVPMAEYNAEKQDCGMIVNSFKDAGFVNVSTEVYTGKYREHARNNMVHSVEINGDDYFYKGDRRALDAKVIVYYYAINYESCTVYNMMSALVNNAYNAKEYYSGKYVSATGWVESIDSSGRKFELVASPSGYEFIGITCNVKNDEQKAVVAKLSKGKKITVKGKITLTSDLGYYMDIHEIKY